MWTAPFIEDYPAPSLPLAAIPEAPRVPVRSSAKGHQARAINILANAIGHLSNSHLFLDNMEAVTADADAMHLLRRLKRQVFDDCEVIQSTRQPLRHWMKDHLTSRAN